ncbi:NfeD family protein [uncultured Serinicoccus sp.]|uniref:NfeD family protein n=1 Tax=uncultured Serinicoccus sp. TaxID=735514 RepID=UPI00260FD051|nr:NfeD family protein [uncultured Serinicoccus sp.]
MPDWLRDSPQWLWWIGAALAFGIVEMTTLDLLFLMLALGALVAAVVAGATGVGLIWQVLIFAVASGLFVFALRPVALRHLRLEGKGGKILMEGNIGQTATVLEPVSDRDGLVKLRGENWTARAELEGQTFAAGDLVTVVRIDGATAVVTAATPEDKPFDLEPPRD